VTHVDYDRPSGWLGTLGNETVSEVAWMRDPKIHELAMRAAGEVPAPGATTPGGKSLNTSRFIVDHVRLTADKPFGEVAAALERQLGRFDPDVYQELSRLPKVISHRRRKSLENKAFSEKSLSLIVS
jgi:hypothetical protein